MAGEPILILLDYLHSKMELTDAFEQTITTMLEAFTTDKTYIKLRKVQFKQGV